MDHSIAKTIFEEIQARPFGVSLAPGVPSNNCYYKGIELLQKLGSLGYAVRGNVGETFWDPALFPSEILALEPKDVLITHFYIEAFIDEKWRILDSTFQPTLAKHGLYIGSWEGTPRSCCPITRLYTHEENIAYQQILNNPDYARDYFTKSAAFLNSLNAWFQDIDVKNEIESDT